MTVLLRLTLILFCFPCVLLGAPFPPGNSEAVIKQAIVKAAPCIVKIETIGGLDLVNGELANTGPTTGVIVSSDGLIITSSFNFAAKPASILVTLSEGQKRLPAQVVAKDHLKNLTLLKVAAQDLTPAQPSKLKEIQVGQWAIAMGKTYRSPLPNISLGLVSALGRIDGKAIQTDAKVSPTNYGGPLTDIEGNVIGILVPLSPSGKGLADGVNWYDSGIGFAIPLQDVLDSLARLKTGKDLHPGLMGISFGTTPPFLAEPIAREIRPISPASKAGLKTEDRIISVNGKEIKTVANIKQALGTKYAGDTISIVALRNEKKESFELTLTDKLEIFHHAWLGILEEPIRDSEEPGIPVRFVFPDSPAQKSGIEKGDRILLVGETKLNSLDDLRQAVNLKQPKDQLKLTIFRDEEKKITVSMADALAEIPVQIPLPVMAREKAKEAEEKPAIKLGDQVVELKEHGQKYRIYVPEDYSGESEYGITFWLSSDGEPVPKTELSQWKRICRNRGMVLVAPVSENLEAWSIDDLSWLKACLEDVESNYRINSKQTVLITTGKDPSLPWLFAFENRELFEGILSMSVPRRFRPPYNNPGYRIEVLLAMIGEDQQKLSGQINNFLSSQGFPISSHSVKGEELEVEDFDAIGRWFEIVRGL